ncbi:hypothetical protein H5395_15430 [Paracoccus sp. MC1854]|uniref:hypothetical protein n=1 Tax=Paracoccus sp. MC1854 TaxID=2760306 RepID=UPI0016000099|nr:hypothetical protein [Paracoccus sp. MC1854]MBB1492887.1 hypothetical protein [Paracoccus sp. MC1854]
MARPRCSILVAILTLLAGGVSAAPFGINYEADTPEKLGCESIKSNFYRCKTLPAMHPDMEYYVIQYEPTVGFCMIKGVGINISDNRFGYKTQALTDRVADQVKRKYGTPQKLDYLKTGSIWDEPEDWMMGIKIQERSYAYLWSPSPPIEGIEGIIVGAHALDAETGYVNVEFHTPRTDECDAAADSSASEAF